MHALVYQVVQKGRRPNLELATAALGDDAEQPAMSTLLHLVEDGWSREAEKRPSVDALLHAIEAVLNERAPMRPKRRDDAKALAAGKRMRRDYECDFDEIEVGEELGKGAFDIVSKGTLRGEVVAVKQLKGVVDSHGYVEMKKLDEFVAELDVIARLRHPSIVRRGARVRRSLAPRTPTPPRRRCCCSRRR